MEKEYRGISYKIFNASKPQTILFLHGWGQRKECFDFLISYLKQKYCCISIDLPGFGKSNLKRLNVQEYAKEIEKIIKYENLNISLIVGHSFGGKVATEYALSIKDCPLLLFAPSIIKPKFSLKKKFKVIKYKIYKRLNIRKDKINQMGSYDYLNSKGVLRKNFMDAINTYYNKSLKNIKSEMLLYFGNEDQEVDCKVCKYIKKKKKNVECIIIPGDHFVFISERYHALATIERFMVKLYG